jgi:hypothetical protein
MRHLIVKNWEKFQHYHDRNPPWIKLHRALLDDYEFSCLNDVNKAHLMLIWLFASQNDGRIPEDAKFLQRKLSLERPPNLQFLIDHGLLIPERGASTAIQSPETDDSAVRLEKRREETEKRALAFAQFWAAYPKRVAKPDAIKAFKDISLENDFSRLMAAIEVERNSEQWLRDNGKFIPHPATWLRKRRFEDEPIAPAPEQKATLAL